MATDTKRDHIWLQVKLRNKREKQIIRLVAAHMRRNMSDATRELFTREHERIQREEQEQTQLTTQTS